MKPQNYFLLASFLLLFGCRSGQKENEALAGKLQPVEIKNPVGVMVLESTTFQKELISNGKLSALKKSILKFSTSEELTNLYVRNGDHVEKGQVLARLRQDRFKQALEQAEIQLESAELDLKDNLIRQNYNLEDSMNIPSEVFGIARIRSGYASARQGVQKARMDLQNSVLIAPFSGIVANLEYKVYENVSASEEFCTLLDNSVFEVEFYVLETEIRDISLNKSVSVTPFIKADEIYRGKISEINPVVDENGHILVKALVNNTGGLLEGMNVKVKIETAVPGRLVVPKSAVVQRQDQEVVFIYTRGIAFWTYVQTLDENSTSYSVIAHPDKGGKLEPGDTVIISGNLNLAHESEVVIE